MCELKGTGCIQRGTYHTIKKTLKLSREKKSQTFRFKHFQVGCALEECIKCIKKKNPIKMPLFDHTQNAEENYGLKL